MVLEFRCRLSVRRQTDASGSVWIRANRAMVAEVMEEVTVEVMAASLIHGALRFEVCL